MGGPEGPTEGFVIELFKAVELREDEFDNTADIDDRVGDKVVVVLGRIGIDDDGRTEGATLGNCDVGVKVVFTIRLVGLGCWDGDIDIGLSDDDATVGDVVDAVGASDGCPVAAQQKAYT